MKGEPGEKTERGRRVTAMLSRWPATALVAAAILALSHIPPPALPKVPLLPHADKAVHFVEYLVFGGLLFRSLRYEFSGNSCLAAIIACVGGTAFGLLDEWHQGFVGRSPDLADVWADLAGLLVGTACVVAATRWRTVHDR